MGRNRLNGWRLWVRMVCALAIVAVGFAHRMPPAMAGMPAVSLTLEEAAYLLPDGTLPGLCVPDTARGEDGKGPPAGTGMPACEACRIAGSVLLPTPADTPGIPAGRIIERLKPVYEAPPARLARAGNALSRAPPPLLV